VYTARHTNGTAPGDGPATPSLRSERAYGELKTRLLLGEFPLNVRLGEERLAGLVGVSRTPVREALARLHAEGIVVRLPDGGFAPAAPDVALIRHLYEVRIGLELQALDRPGQFGATHDGAALARLQDEWLALAGEAAEPDPSFVLLDEAFHEGLADAAGNPVLTDHLQQVNERIRVVRMQDFLTVERVEVTIAEHLGLIAAVAEGDISGARSGFLAHLEASLAVVEQRTLAAVNRMIQGGRP
jgi:DNA-binding GntR family transcriptional regulator